MKTENCDVVVVGFGNAAQAAAVAAHNAGAKVLVLEKAPQAKKGGNTAVKFDLLFTLAFEIAATTGTTTTACLLAQMAPHTLQAWSNVLNLCERHLQFGLSCFGTVGKNTKNHFRSVNDRNSKNSLEVTLLGRGDLIIENDKFGMKRVDCISHIFQLALAQKGSCSKAAHLKGEFF